MAEESVGDFLKKLSPERKPLSEVERREAMEVADAIQYMAVRKIDMATKKTGIKKFGIFLVESQDLRRKLSVYLDEKDIERFKPDNPQTNLVIQANDFVKERPTVKVSPSANILRTYFFGPDEVVVKELTSGGGKIGDVSLDLDADTNEIKVSFKDPDQAKRALEQNTLEAYHPDKVDLSGLLSDLSAAEPE